MDRRNMCLCIRPKTIGQTVGIDCCVVCIVLVCIDFGFVCIVLVCIDCCIVCTVLSCIDCCIVCQSKDTMLTDCTTLHASNLTYLKVF